MKRCKKIGCTREVIGNPRKRYCSNRCKLDVKNQKEYAKKKLLRATGGVDESDFGTKFDCVLSLEWLMRPLRAV